MPDFYFYGNDTGSVVNADMSTLSSATTFVTAGVTVANDSGSAVVGDASYQNVNVYGLLLGSSNTIDLDGDYSSINVGNSGVVTTGNYGDNPAVNVSGFHSLVTNSGEIAGGMGVWVGGNDSYVSNTGTITGMGSGYYNYSAAVVFYVVQDYVGSAPTENFKGTVINTGTLMGAHYGYYGYEYPLIAVEDRGSSYTIDGAGATSWKTDLTVKNHGEMIGGMLLNHGDDLVVNSGLVIGDIDFGADNDTYRGQSDGQVDGVVLGGAGDDVLSGGNVGDVLDGGDDNDLLRGNGGNDDLIGGAGRDTLKGGDGHDTLDGGAGNDTLNGGDGHDDLNGGGSKDILRGNLGDDTLNGSGGNDTLNGGQGDDELTGGAGSDRFVFTRVAGQDVITDFEDGSDKINLAAYDLANYAALNSAGAISSVTGGVMIDLDLIGGQGSIFIDGGVLGNFGAGDFVF